MQAALEYIPDSEGNQKLWDYTRKAAELDPNLAEVEVNFADVRFYQVWDWSGGEAGFRRAFEMDPGSESVVYHYALCLHVLGRYEEAIGVLERALQLNPHSSLLNYALVGIFLDSRRYEPAIEHHRKMIGLEPNDAEIYNSLGNLYGDLGRDEEAVKAYLKARSLAGDSTDRVQALRDAHKARGLQGYWRMRLEHLMEAREDVPPLTLAYVYAGLGEKNQALAWVDNLKEAAKHKRDTPLTFAEIYAVLGEKDQALVWLEKAFEQRRPLLAWLKASRLWDPLRDDPRFQDLLRRMNFPE
jgi:serine/threonine-protein kinase